MKYQKLKDSRTVCKTESENIMKVNLIVVGFKVQYPQNVKYQVIPLPQISYVTSS